MTPEEYAILEVLLTKAANEASNIQYKDTYHRALSIVMLNKDSN